jgi:hypothetical protein
VINGFLITISTGEEMQEQDFSFFDNRGLIPPFLQTPAHGGKSPYTISLTQFVCDFSIGCSRFDRAKRISILKGYLKYRSMLHDAGLTAGIQWVNGSFVTYKELIHNASPNDIDVLSIIMLPEGESQQSFKDKNSALFERKNLKDELCVDANYLLLHPSKISLVELLERVNYWNNLWSHERETLNWKGYFQIDLSPEEDLRAHAELVNISKGVENETT